jgi:anaerobic dimethyl sulfoxide reductase subunit C (anchor subunit)
MNTQEWALILFTILSQMAVGAFWVLGVVHTYARRKAGETAADRMSDGALMVIGPVLVLAFIASLFHLGSPLNAPRAVISLGTSWLSREIFFGALFAMVGALFALLQWRKIGSPNLRTVLAWVAAAVGLAFIISMAMVYMVPAQPAWNTFLTPISFFTTTALLGLFTVGASYVFNYNYVKERDPDCAEQQCALLRSALRGISVTSILLLGVQLVTIPVYLVSLANMGPAAIETARLMAEDYLVLLVLQLALLFIGAGVLALFLYRNASSAGREQSMSRLAYAAFLCIFIGAVVGRYLFYATRVRVGV